MPVQIALKYEASDILQDKSTHRVSLTQAGPCWSELQCLTSAEDREGVFCPGDKAIAHNHLQISLLYCLWLLLVIYTSEQWKPWRNPLAQALQAFIKA